MAIIKSFTDLEQSKKLSEILPLESADMYRVFENNAETRVYYGKMPTAHFVCKPCWSLAALLSVLPTYLFKFSRGIDLNIYPNLNSKGWHCSYMPNCIENMKKDKFRLITSKDNIIDACYEMILKLYELKLL